MRPEVSVSLWFCLRKDFYRLTAANQKQFLFLSLATVARLSKLNLECKKQDFVHHNFLSKKKVITLKECSAERRVVCTRKNIVHLPSKKKKIK